MMSVNDDDDDEDNKNCMSYSKVIIAILDHSAATQSFELSCMPLVEKIRNNYKNLINSNINCVCSYACFLFRTLRAGYKSKKPICKILILKNLNFFQLLLLEISNFKLQNGRSI
jgi:hypothetical protein